MASWGLLIALSGYAYDVPRGRISFQPHLKEQDFSCFFTTASAWGVYRQKREPVSGERTWDVEVMYGSLEGITVNGRESS